MKHLQSSAVAEAIRHCASCACRKLVKAPVSGIGPSNARIVCVARNPGRDEDRAGVPLVGKAGQVFDRMLLRLFGISRDDVGILNTVSCFTANNRQPFPEEILACARHREAQLAFFESKILVLAFGRQAIEAMIGPVAGKLQDVIGDLRRPVPIAGRTNPNLWGVIPLWHPAFLLRDRKFAVEFGERSAPLIRSTIQRCLDAGVPWARESQNTLSGLD